FQTSSDEATKLLSHSLGQLKHVLESAGVNVDRLHVQQAPKDEQSNARGEDGQRDPRREEQSESQRQEQQRKEMMRRMWRKLTGRDPLDTVA
ncbi:MAG: hypothetical protein ACREIT_07475, partial [Tepidisphaeraceae bacterium]